MKKIILLFALMAFVACKDEKKTGKTDPAKETPVAKEKEKEVVPAYPAIQKFDQELRFIHDELHVFDEEISVEEVAVVPGKEKDTYNFVFYFSDETNYEKLENYYLALMLYPEDPSTIEKESDRKRGLTTKSVKCELVQDGKSVALVLPDFKILGKKMKSGKAYLYKPGGGILNPGRPKLIIKEFSL
ncbi:MAG: hypothetical protein AB8B65_02160 [Kordia sp.]|uniref:hypothetical protein n=1 Tax=Kordia sp. TaxID=1965332 RepID=UPI00385B9AC3